MLELLRKLKQDGVDDSQYIHLLTYNQLLDENFRAIDEREVKQLCLIELALMRLIEKSSVTKAKMLASLNVDEYEEYLSSFDYDISHVESDEFDLSLMPQILVEYNEYVRMGDKYTRIANLFKYSTKRDGNGKTAFTRYEDKAFGYYEEAVMLITCAVDTDSKRNHNPDVRLSAEIQRWLDRDVSAEIAYAPDVSAEGVPRIIGSKSKYSLINKKPVAGVRLRKYWRQREALVKSSLKLLYSEDALESHMLQGSDVDHQKLRLKLEQLRAVKI